MTSTTTTRGVLVVGAGVIGLATALELARRGVAALVLERDRAGRGATWAAGGMLTPLGEAAGPGPFLRLGVESLARWPDFAAALADASGMAVGFRRCGKLLVALDPAEAEALDRRRAWQTAAGFDVRTLTPEEAREVEPALAPEVTSALHLDSDGVVDNRRLGEALVEAARRAGVTLREGVEVSSVRARGGRIEGVELADGRTLAADVVVVAAGAWSGRIGGLPRPLPVRPVRGQMLALSSAGVSLRGLVGGPGAYLIPREGDEGRIVVGATEEEVGFTPGTEEPAIGALHRSAAAIVPGLRDAPEVERWWGYRPGTPDDLPVLGPDPEVAGLVWATGHFRNGILLAPVTAHRIAEGITGASGIDLEAFRPDRFEG